MPVSACTLRAASWACASLRLVQITLQPRFANSRAMPSPVFRAAPVIKTHFMVYRSFPAQLPY